MKPYRVQIEISGPIALWARPDTMPNPVSYVAPTLSAAKGIFEAVLRWKSVNVLPISCEICAPVQFHRYAFNYGVASGLFETTVLVEGVEDRIEGSAQNISWRRCSNTTGLMFQSADLTQRYGVRSARLSLTRKRKQAKKSPLNRLYYVLKMVADKILKHISRYGDSSIKWLIGIRSPRLHPYDGRELPFPTRAWKFFYAQSPEEALKVFEEVSILVPIRRVDFIEPNCSSIFVCQVRQFPPASDDVHLRVCW